MLSNQCCQGQDGKSKPLLSENMTFSLLASVVRKLTDKTSEFGLSILQAPLTSIYFYYVFCLNFYFFLFYLKGRVRGTDRKRDLPSTCSLCNCMQQPGLGQTEARSQELHQRTGLEERAGTLTGSWVTDGILTHCATKQPSIHVLSNLHYNIFCSYFVLLNAVVNLLLCLIY